MVNDGLHLHAIVLVPWKSRLGTGLKSHVRENARLYLGNHGKLRRVDMQRIERGTEAGVVDYAMETWRSRRMSMDNVLVLPRAASELWSPHYAGRQLWPAPSSAVFCAFRTSVLHGSTVWAH